MRFIPVALLVLSGCGASTLAGGDAVVTASVDCRNRTVTVTSSKDLSNVVLRSSDRPDFKHDGLSGHSATFGFNGDLLGVFIKSGNNASGEGPGYGAWVPVEGCKVAPTQPADTPTPGPTSPTPTSPGEQPSSHPDPGPTGDKDGDQHENPPSVKPRPSLPAAGR